MDTVRAVICATCLIIPAHSWAMNTNPATEATSHVHGLSKAEIETRFGAPNSRHGPVPAHGTKHQPPITTWVFDDFSVYFERDLALHKVEHRKTPQKQLHSSGKP